MHNNNNIRGLSITMLGLLLLIIIITIILVYAANSRAEATPPEQPSMAPRTGTCTTRRPIVGEVMHGQTPQGDI